MRSNTGRGHNQFYSWLKEFFREFYRFSTFISSSETCSSFSFSSSFTEFYSSSSPPSSSLLASCSSSALRTLWTVLFCDYYCWVVGLQYMHVLVNCMHSPASLMASTGPRLPLCGPGHCCQWLFYSSFCFSSMCASIFHVSALPK